MEQLGPLRSPYGLPSRPQLRCLVGRADGRRANALPCNRPLEYAGSYLSKKPGIALQFTFFKEIPSTLIVDNPMGIIIGYLQVDEALGAIAR